jgi:hypothetical protein
MYYLTKDGFSMLVMSFTGSKAAKFKEDFIEQFNKMDEILRQGGYSSAPELLKTYTSRILKNPTVNMPYGYWSIFDESHTVMLWIEKHIGSISEYDIADGSIGKRWAEYRKGKEWAVKASSFDYVYDDKRGERTVNCYQYAELIHFRTWVRDVYKPKHLIKYLSDKYKSEKNIYMLDRVNEVAPKFLSSGKNWN